MKNKLTLIFSVLSYFYLSQAAAAESVIKFAPSGGTIVDYGASKFSEKSGVSGELIEIREKGDSATLNPNQLPINGKVVSRISGQVTYQFSAPKAVWFFSCNTSTGLGFLSVHSDATEVQAGRLLTKYGICTKVK